MPLEIRRAIANDAPGIAQVKQAVWPDDDTAESRPLDRVILEAMRDSNRVTFVSVEGDKVVGFADGFLTISADGVLRWEVDLLAVHPDYRGRGLAARLVKASTEAGREMGAQVARALVQVENYASQQTFARCGYHPEAGDCVLMKSADAQKRVPTNPVRSVGTAFLPSVIQKQEPDAYLLPVNTFNYRGLWLEGDLTLDAFQIAQTVRVHHRLDIAGAVIPIDQDSAVQTAHEAGFHRIDHYDWWRFDY